MKRLKEFFKMIVTAVICFTMSVFTRNKAEEKIVRVLGSGNNVLRCVGGQADAVVNGGNWENRNSNAFLCNRRSLFCSHRSNVIEFRRYRRRLRLKKMLRWFQGPGDSKGKLFEASG